MNSQENTQNHTAQNNDDNVADTVNVHPEGLKEANENSAPTPVGLLRADKTTAWENKISNQPIFDLHDSTAELIAHLLLREISADQINLTETILRGLSTFNKAGLITDAQFQAIVVGQRLDDLRDRVVSSFFTTPQEVVERMFASPENKMRKDFSDEVEALLDDVASEKITLTDAQWNELQGIAYGVDGGQYLANRIAFVRKGIQDRFPLLIDPSASANC